MFWKCADMPQYTRGGLKPTCGAGALLLPLHGSQGLHSGCQVASAWQAPSPRDHLAGPFHLLVTNTSLWGLHSPRYTSNLIKLWKKRIHFLKKSTLWSYWLNMEWLFSSEDSKILFSSNIDLTVYFDKWLRKINEALTINTNVYVHFYILRGCPMISYASDLNYNKFSQ